jgi:hypothetical protein
MSYANVEERNTDVAWDSATAALDTIVSEKAVPRRVSR